MAAKQTTGDPLVPSTILADWLNVSRITIIDLTARGIAVKVGDRYDLRASVRAYASHMSKALTGRGGEKAAAAIAGERAWLAHEQADHVALKNARARGSMVHAHEVEVEWSSVLRTVRAGILAVPSLAHLTPHDLSTIDAEVRAALEGIGNDRAK